MNNCCIAGCMVFTGGEIKHHEHCPNYPDSLSMKYDFYQNFFQEARVLLLFTEDYGKLHNGFRTKEIIIQLRKLVSKEEKGDYNI